MTLKKPKKSKIVDVKAKKSLSEDFYPQEGTMFVYKQVSYIVESKENLSVLSDETKDVACYSLVNGFEDFSDWTSLVKSGEVDVVWCPKNGRVKSNDAYLVT